MNYTIEIYDRAGLRVGRFDEVPLLEVVRESPDGADRISGLLPVSLARFGVGYTVHIYFDDVRFTAAAVQEVRPAWGEARRLILDRYVNFQELLAFEARTETSPANSTVAQRFENKRIDAMVRLLLNSALGPVHYTVAHEAYPDGATREYTKFQARQALSEALPIGGIETGQWVDGSRIDLTSAYAKDGDTIAGLEVDGVAWPDLRLMMIDCEETSLNSHAIARHPEIADWTVAQYNASKYKLRAEAAKQRLQHYIDTHGIDYIELNPHQDPSGVYDDRVDLYGRYLGLIFGGSQCFNAGLVEEGHADVYLYDNGRYHVPEMALKDFYSYTGAHMNSIESCSTVIGAFEARGGVLEVLTALAAMAGGYIFQVDSDLAVRFRRGDHIDQVVTFDPVVASIDLGRDRKGLANLLRIQGDPMHGGVDGYHSDQESIDRFGVAFRYFPYFALSQEADAQRLGEGLLNDLAWPRRVGAARFHRGLAGVSPGNLLEFRGSPLTEFDNDLDPEWNSTFNDKLVGRVERVTHRIAGRSVETQLDLTSPYRSVAQPLTFITRSQDSLSAFFQFRLDDQAIGLDLGFHLD